MKFQSNNNQRYQKPYPLQKPREDPRGFKQQPTYHQSDEHIFKGKQFHSGEGQLLPNEIRINSMGNAKVYCDIAVRTFEQGYENIKIVGRGMAVELTEEVTQELKKRAPYCFYMVRFAQALNKKGEIVEEMHVMMCKKTVHQNTSNEELVRSFKEHHNPRQF